MALVFLFILCCSTSVLIGECVLLLYSVLFFHTKPRDWLGERLRNFVCRVGRKTLTQSINELYIHSQYMLVVKSVIRSVPLPVVWEVRKRRFCPGRYKSVVSNVCKRCFH